MRPMFLNMLLNCMYSGYEPKPSKLPRVSGSSPRWGSAANLHVMVVERQDVRDLRERLPQVRLVEMARVVMKVGVRDVLLVARGPRSVLTVLLAARSGPLLQQWDLFPHPVRVDLPSETQLSVEAVAIYVLLQYVLPHEADPAQLGALVGVDVDGEIVARVSDESPGRLGTPGHEEFVSRAAKMRRDSVGPFSALLLHLQVDVVPEEYPPLMAVDGVRFELSRIRGEIHALVNVYRRRVLGIGDEHDGTQPQAALKVHVGIPQVRTEVNAVRGLDLVNVDAGRRWRTGESRGRWALHARHAQRGFGTIGGRLRWKPWRGQRLAEGGGGRRGERVDEGAGR